MDGLAARVSCKELFSVSDLWSLDLKQIKSKGRRPKAQGLRPFKEGSWPGCVELFDSSANRARQSGWRLKLPENLLTVPDIGSSHWSQIIRTLFTSTWKDAHQIGRLSICLITSYATTEPCYQEHKDAENTNESVMKTDRDSGTSQSEGSI
jgi:hypothetical protein